MNIINVYSLPPKEKHPAVFKMFETISSGDSFIINNDHDPKPLYYQMLAQLGPVFEWNYLLEGPQNWSVKIVKNSKENNQITVGEIVASDYRKAQVFKKYGLDFCCGGKKSLIDACNDKGIDVLQLDKELKMVDNESKLPSQNYNDWDLGFLIDYIVNTHHKYVVKAIPEIFEIVQKVSKVHGNENPETKEVLNHFIVVSDELNRHMMKEENVLFPYIKQLELSNKRDLKLDPPPFGTVKNPVRMMEAEHDIAGDVLKEIQKLTNNYTPPENACNSFIVAYNKLREFEEDLHQHIHLENNILFPKAIELEEKFFG